METHPNTVERMLLVGGDPALDFVNTLAGLLSTGPLPEDEHIHTYNDLLDFGVRTGTLSEEQARRLAEEAKRRPADADAALQAAFELRALIEDVFRPLAAGDRPAEELLRALRDADEEALTHAELVPAGHSYEWGWPEEARDLRAPIWPFAHRAVELLTSDLVERLKGCKRCRWLFLDVSKNRSRRWCSMEGCGTDEKKERYTERRRARRGI